jgi:hypothetical protein
LTKTKVIPYGTPEPESDLIERDHRGGWQPVSGKHVESKAYRIAFMGQHHASGDPHRVLKEVVRACREPVVLLQHADDAVGVDRDVCDSVAWQEQDRRRGILRDAEVVVTEYSNSGYGLALAGKRVHFLYEDPPEGECGALTHLAIELRRELPVTPSQSLSQDSIYKEIEKARRRKTVRTQFRPQLDLRHLRQACVS